MRNFFILIVSMMVLMSMSTALAQYPDPYQFISLGELEDGARIHSPTSNEQHVWWYKAGDDCFTSVEEDIATTFIVPKDVLFASRFHTATGGYRWRDSIIRASLNNTQSEFYTSLSETFRSAVVPCFVYTVDNSNSANDNNPVKVTEDIFIVPSFAEYSNSKVHDQDDDEQIVFLGKYYTELCENNNYTTRWSRSNYKDPDKKELVVTAAKGSNTIISPQAIAPNKGEVDVWAGVNLKSDTLVCGPFMDQDDKEYYKLFPNDDVVINTVDSNGVVIINPSDSTYSNVLVGASYNEYGDLIDIEIEKISLAGKTAKSYSVLYPTDGQHKLFLFDALSSVKPILRSNINPE